MEMKYKKTTITYMIMVNVGIWWKITSEARLLEICERKRLFYAFQQSRELRYVTIFSISVLSFLSLSHTLLTSENVDCGTKSFAFHSLVVYVIDFNMLFIINGLSSLSAYI